MRHNLQGQFPPDQLLFVFLIDKGFLNSVFRHNFDCLSPICICGTGKEDNEHYLLHCPQFTAQRQDLLGQVSDVGYRGAFHSFEKAYEIFSEQKDFYGFLMDFPCKQKDFCQRRTRFFGVGSRKMLSNWFIVT